MKVTLFLAPDADSFEQRCFALDRRTNYPAQIEVEAVDEEPAISTDSSLIFIYGPPALSNLRIPIAATRPVTAKRHWWPLRPRLRGEALIATEFAERESAGRTFVVPEAVDPEFSLVREKRGTRPLVAWVERPEVRELMRSVISRAQRFRDDIEWRAIRPPLEPRNLEEVSVFLDPAIHDGDRGGGLAEAMVAGLPTVAARTPINRVRALGGEAGILVPPGDPNEIVHALLNQTFKPELSASLLETSDREIGRFDPERRARHLAEAWQALT